ncbi:hypothetical protein B0H66DRAFT_599646 [Apodospora peruviana]|uniref:Uncharacterized protein n=1 Tax=Apodospora peruviana TaxID=516989 RepID=A0AAE0MAZ5_9PEZI|nr:hypothetical protein B0H66DRAFT_599646 [Apodospora peruviana]
MAVGVCERRVVDWPTLPVKKSKRKDLVLLREGVDIAVDYFNFGERTNIQALTILATKWCAKYFQGYHYAPNRATGLLKKFPNLFNLSVQAYSRLIPAAMAPTKHSEPEGASPRHLRKAERKAANSESFPEFVEPTLATTDEMDEIVDLRPRSAFQGKPDMRVDPSMLRGSGLLDTLPEFLGQLARANLETETLLASNPSAARFELDEADAAQQRHIEMNLFAGVAETQRRRYARRIIMPGGRQFKLEQELDDASNKVDSEMSDNDEERDHEDDEQSSSSGHESDASTSTVASLHAKSKKRKAAAASKDDDEDEDKDSQPNKIRIQYQYPTDTLKSFDMTRRKIVSRANPAAGADHDPFAERHLASKEVDRPSSSSSTESSSSSSSSSAGSKRIIKIKVSKSISSRSSGSGNSSGNSSRVSTPEPRIIRLKDPRSSPSSSSSASSSTQASPRTSPKIKIIRPLRSVSPALPLANGGGDKRPSSSGSDSSSSSSSSSSSVKSGVTKIRFIPKLQPTTQRT